MTGGWEQGVKRDKERAARGRACADGLRQRGGRARGAAGSTVSFCGFGGGWTLKWSSLYCGVVSDSLRFSTKRSVRGEEKAFFAKRIGETVSGRLGLGWAWLPAWRAVTCRISQTRAGGFWMSAN